MSTELLDKLGVKYLSRDNKVSKLRIDWPPRQWVDLVNREGPWLPRCCAEISTIRDILVTTLKENGWISTDTLHEAVELMRSHGGWELFDADLSNEEFTVMREGWVDPNIDVQSDEQNPFLRLADIWRAAREVCVFSIKNENELDPNKLKDALFLMTSGSHLLTWSLLHKDEITGPVKAQRAILLSRLIPAMRTLNTSINDMSLGEVWGLAVVAKGTGRLLRNRLGLAIYAKQSEVNEVLSIWKKDDPEVEAKIDVRPVQISMQHGVKFLDEL